MAPEKEYLIEAPPYGRLGQMLRTAVHSGVALGGQRHSKKRIAHAIGGSGGLRPAANIENRIEKQIEKQACILSDF